MSALLGILRDVGAGLVPAHAPMPGKPETGQPQGVPLHLVILREVARYTWHLDSAASLRAAMTERVLQSFYT
jgi:hypothetical protein